MSLTEETQNSDPPKRRDSDASRTSSGSSGSNPLMTLVDAATTMVDSKKIKTEDVSNATEAASTEDPSSKNTDEEKTGEMNVEESAQDDKQSAVDTKKPEVAEVAKEASNIITGTKEDLVCETTKKRTFAEQLYDILEDEEHHDVLQWMPDGLAFTIVDHKKFTLNKMPKLFNIRNMSSFVRKLGRWGFSRVHEKATRNSDIFKHPLFERGKRDQCKKKVKCVGRAANANKNAPPMAASPLGGSHHRYPVHLHTVSPRYDAPLSPSTHMFMSNLSERSHLSALSTSERSRYSFVGATPTSRVTFLNDHMPRLPSELPLYNDQIPQQSRLPEKLPLYGGDRHLSHANPDTPNKQRALSKVTAASEASAAALFNQHQKSRTTDTYHRRDSQQLSPFEEARRLSELDRQLAEQQVALEHRKVALEHQRIVRQRQSLMAQRRAMERQLSERGRDVHHIKSPIDGAPTDRAMTSTSETSVAISLDSSARSGYSPSSARSGSQLSRDEAIRALLREERQRSYNEARERDRQLAGHPSVLNGTSSHSSTSAASRPPSGAW